MSNPTVLGGTRLSEVRESQGTRGKRSLERKLQEKVIRFKRQIFGCLSGAIYYMGNATSKGQALRR